MSHSRKKHPYRKSRAFDKSCRCHGGCPWCLGNKMHKLKKQLAAAKDEIKRLEELYTGAY